MYSSININVCKYRYIALVSSVIYITIALLVLLFKGMNLGIDFKGGIMLEIKTNNKNITEIRSLFKEIGYSNADIQTVGDQDNYLIKLLPQSHLSNLETIETIKKELNAKIDDGVEFRKVDYVGPKMGISLIQKGVSAVMISLLGILLYVGFRFNFSMSMAATLALVHDMLAVFCFYVVSGIEFNVSSIAAILIILGYSINDSVVVFDRMRENLRKYSIKQYLTLVNISIKETLSRTIITSFTTLIVTASIAILGGETLRGFSLALCFGIIVGTYSTIFIASPFSGIFAKNTTMQAQGTDTAAQTGSKNGNASSVRMRKAVM